MAGIVTYKPSSTRVLIEAHLETERQKEKRCGRLVHPFFHAHVFVWGLQLRSLLGLCFLQT